ncbi:BRCT domain-containing protein [Verrucomicrobiota bacterium sgz303538]
MDSLGLLDALISSNRLSPKRSNELLRGFDHEPTKWAFAVPEHFNGAIDIVQNATGSETGLRVPEWSQGAMFSFQPGDVLYDHLSGYTEVWSEALSYVRRIVTVIEAKAVAASGRTTGPDGKPGQRIPRDPGTVTFKLQRVDPDSHKVTQGNVCTLTQDDFVRFLITGTPQTSLTTQSEPAVDHSSPNTKTTPRRYILRTLPEEARKPRPFTVQNNERKAVDELTGICKGILADGVVCDAEAKFFQQWLSSHPAVVRTWPFREIAARVAAVFADGRIDDDEREELKVIMSQIVGDDTPETLFQDTSCRLPLDDPQPEYIDFQGSEFCVTGKFACGPRSKVVEMIEENGGYVSDGVRTTTDYLVVGCFASRDWKHANYGTKIERAMELRDKDGTPRIVSEETLMQVLGFEMAAGAGS